MTSIVDRTFTTRYGSMFIVVIGFTNPESYKAVASFLVWAKLRRS